MDRQRRRNRKRTSKQIKHTVAHPGELLVFGTTTAAVKKIWLPDGAPVDPKRKTWVPDFYITGDDAKPAAPAQQP